MSNQEVTSQDYEFQQGKLKVNDVNNLIGEILTLIDASIDDENKQEALKSVMQNRIWDWATEWKTFATEDELEDIKENATEYVLYGEGSGTEDIEFAGWSSSVSSN